MNHERGTYSDDDPPIVSNQTVLGSGCVCSHGCDSCDRLAEAWTAMRGSLEWLLNEPIENIYPLLGRMRSHARAALALAGKVSR